MSDIDTKMIHDAQLEMQTTQIGIPPEEGKFCADCAYLVGVRYKKEDVDKWNCGHPENSAWEKVNLITGIKKRVFLRTITTLRYPDNPVLATDVCGPEGKWYKKYVNPAEAKYEIVENNIGQTKFERPKPLSSAALGKLTKKLDLGMDPE